MDNQGDQFQKNMYQVPQNGVLLDGEPLPINALSDEEVERTFEDIAREETNRTFAEIAAEDIRSDFNKMTEDLEMSLLGRSAVQEKVELVSPHPVAEQLLQIGETAEIKRNEYQAELAKDRQKRHMMAWIVSLLFTNNHLKTPAPTLDSILDHESKVGGIFPADPDVKEMKFFFLKDNGTHKWYHVQESAVSTKDFTNTYSVNLFGIDKSSTFYDPSRGQKVNVSVPVQDDEAQNLLIAAKKYYEEVTGKVYVKSAAPRLRFGSKNDHDLAA